MTIERIKKVMPAPTQATRIAIDWKAVHEAMKCELPKDYIEFVDTYGLGSVGEFLSILHPSTQNKYLNMVKQLDTQRLVVAEVREDAGPDFAAHIFPKPGGLIPWGMTDNGDVCFWKTGNVDPSRWPVVVYDSKYIDCEMYPGTMTEFLADTLTGKRKSDIFPDDFPDLGHMVFVPHRDESAA